MKRLLVIIFSIGTSLFSLAQSQDSISLNRKNVVKFLPVNLPFQSISFEYERMINAKNSATLGIGIPSEQSIKGKYAIIDDIDNLKSANFSTLHIRAAYRHYTGKSMLPRGFYVEPYLKYQKIGANFNVVSTDPAYSINETYDVKLNSMNCGIQLGTQFLIAKRVSLDFYFLGFEAGFLSGDSKSVFDRVEEADMFKSNLENLFDGDNEDIQYVGKIITSVGKKIEITQSTDKKTINTKAKRIAYPWLRSGFSIGVVF